MKPALLGEASLAAYAVAASATLITLGFRLPSSFKTFAAPFSGLCGIIACDTAGNAGGGVGFVDGYGAGSVPHSV